MKNTIFLFLSFICLSTTLSAQWKSINPGAGGQVQDVVGDPGNPGRLYLASDMEGVYRSEDNGESWEITGQLMHNRVYAVCIDPEVSDRLYVGTAYGLHTSDDAGESYDFIFSTRGRTFASVAVDPNNTDHIIAGPGWRDDYGFFEKLGEVEKGAGEIFLSEDRGASWAPVVFDSNTSTDRNVWTISYDKNSPNTVYIGASKGVFKSVDGGHSWSKIPNPSGTNVSRGVSLSPDGKTLYAAINSDGRMFATPTSSINWQEVMQGDGISLSRFHYWYPEVDSRSEGSVHKVLLGMQGQREGLFEGTFTWSGTELSSYSWERIWDDTGGWDRGWDYATPNARYAHYTPFSWDRAVWSTTNQTIYQGVPGSEVYTWNNKYCTPNENFQVPSWGTTFPTYESRGTESTYTYDIAVHENYVIQGQGDNGFMESWDYGKSWSNMQHRRDGVNLSDVQAVDIADAWGTPLVVAQATTGYGGWATDGRLYVKLLKGHSPNDVWVYLGAGPERKLGTPDGILRDVAVSPANPAKVFLFSSGYGMYMIEDIGKAMDCHKNGLPYEAVNISTSTIQGCKSAKKISPHPSDENVVFFNSSSGTGGVYRGENTDGKWTWEKVYSGYGWDSEVHCWEHEGQVYLMYHGPASGGQGDGNHTITALSLDEGQSWEIVFNKEKARALRQTEWYEEWKDIYTFTTKGGPAAFGSSIIVNYYHHGYQLGYGIFKGTIQEDGTVSWEDWTGDLHYPGPTSSIFAETKDSLFYYTATAGAGAWLRNLGPAAPLPAAPGAPVLESALALNSREIEISWNLEGGMEQGFRIERKTEDGEFNTVGQVGRITGTFTDRGLEQNTTYIYRLLAFNKGGVSAYSDESSVTTPESQELSCVFPNLILNGEFEEDTEGWTLYTNSYAEATLELSDEPGFSGGGSALVNIKKKPVTGAITDIQFYYPFVGAEANKQYELTFKAKGSSAEDLQFLILKNSAPWTNFKTETINLSTAVQDYGPFYFNLPDDYGDVRLDFFLGSFLGEIWFDAFVIRATGECVANLDSLSILSCLTELGVGETRAMSFQAYPLGIEPENFYWSSSDESIAMVSQSGEVSGIAEGRADISVHALQGSGKAISTCSFDVLKAAGLLSPGQGALLVYPNPVSRGSDARIEVAFAGEYYFELYDVRGRFLHQDRAQLDGGTHFILEGKYLERKGIYLLKVYNSQETSCLKLQVV